MKRKHFSNLLFLPHAKETYSGVANFAALQNISQGCENIQTEN